MYVVTERDFPFLRRCIELAAKAVDEGHSPFGSVLVDADGSVLFEDHNRNGDVDETRHPEFAIARWAAENLGPEQRSSCTVYTSGEHCLMCSAAHAMVGLGRIVIVASSDQLRYWRKQMGFIPAGPLAPLPINAVAPGVPVAGPVPELADDIRALHERWAELHSN